MDIEKAQKEFIKYTEKYDLSDVNIKRKQEHSIRVMKISKRIAEGMKLTQEEIDIATLDYYMILRDLNNIQNIIHLKMQKV